MSNFEQTPNFEPITPSAAASMDDIFGVKNTTSDILDEFAGPELEAPVVTEKPKVGFQPKLTPAQQAKLKEEQTKVTNQTVIPEDKVTPERLAALENTIKQILKGQNGVKLGKVPEKSEPLDFTKISEDSIFDFNVPIEAIEHGVPDYLTIQLKDKNYHPRWIHKTPRRLGEMKALGYTYVEGEDIENFESLKETRDENGLFRYDDVVAMKIPKVKIFGMLRRNHERALAQTNVKSHHELAKAAVEGALMNPENTGINPVTGRHDTSKSGDFRKYAGKNQLEVYIPGE